MAEDTVFGVNAVLVYSVLNLLWIAAIVFGYRQYRNGKWSKRTYYIWAGVGIIWLAYGFLNLNQQLFVVGPIRITIFVLLIGIAVFGVYVVTRGVRATTE